MKEKRPGVLVVHEWWGLDDYAKGRCKQLAELGYVAFAPDMYGEGKVVNHPDDSGQDGQRGAREREGVARPRGGGLKQLQSQPNVDGDKLAAIGYCFGGSTCLQLAYSGADLKAVATSTPRSRSRPRPRRRRSSRSCWSATAKRTPSSRRRRSRTSAARSMVPAPSTSSWPTRTWSTASRCPGADAHNIKGMKYDKHADEDSWKKMLALFKDTLGR